MRIVLDGCSPVGQNLMSCSAKFSLHVERLGKPCKECYRGVGGCGGFEERQRLAIVPKVLTELHRILLIDIPRP